MGALHTGHAALIREARTLAGSKGSVAVSIFVNPTQFGPREDLAAYPRPWEKDRALCIKLGVDLVFRPEPAAVYAPDHSIFVEENRLSNVLCGASRPGHFRGVCTVVAKLFLMFQPDIAVFGEKDWQQLAIIRRMVRDLNFRVRIAGVPTVREADGLACSSRNAYLSPEQRAAAPVLRRALLAAAKRVGESGPDAPPITRARLIAAISKEIMKAPEASIDYVDIVNPVTLEPVSRITELTLAAVAVRFGSTRLIDNILLKPIRTPQR